MNKVIIAILSLLILTSSLAGAVEPSEMLSDPVLEQRAREVSRGLRCLVCQNQSIDKSNAGLAKNLSGAKGPLWQIDTDLIAIIMNGVDRSDLPTPMPAKGGNKDFNTDNARSVLQFVGREFGN